MQRIRPLATLSGGLLNRFPFFYAATLAGMTALANAAAADDAGNTSYVSARLPIIGRAMDIGANRSAGLSPTLREMTPVGHPSNTWTKLANLPNAVVHDVAFGDATTGYAAAEEGQIWETTNGGQTWSEMPGPVACSSPIGWGAVLR